MEINDLSQYLSDKDRIEQLEKEIVRLKRRNVEWKCKYKKLHQKFSKRDILLTRTDKALRVIAEIKSKPIEGTVRANVKRIANANFLSVGYVQDLWYKGK